MKQNTRFFIAVLLVILTVSGCHNGNQRNDLNQRHDNNPYYAANSRHSRIVQH